ncbi:MAG: hypothetical protein J0L80_12540 [Chitinophagales bacterium]|nr:hypothetical protein [Chitinophagales bacterium]
MTPENHADWAALKPAHKTFITHYLRTQNKRLAYKEAYPNIADGDSLRSAANRLYRQLQPFIESLTAHAITLALDELMTEAKEVVKTSICTLQQRREVLGKMITGQMQVKRHIRLRDTIVEVYDDVSPAALIRAIDLDSRLAANKYKEKIEQPKQEKAPLLFLGGDAGVSAKQDTTAGVVKLAQEKPAQEKPLEELLKIYPYGHAYWQGRCIKVPAQDVQRLGFDTLDDGLPYLNNNLTDEYHQIRIRQTMEYLKHHNPAVYQDVLTNPEKPVIATDEPQHEDPAPPNANELWKQYLAADTNTRRLSAADRQAKELWFKAIPEKQQIRLIELYSKTG